MKNYFLKSALIIVCFVLIASYTVFSQTIDIKNYNNQTYIIKKNNSSQVSIIPSYGSENLISKINSHKTETDNPNAFNWVLKFTAPGKVFKDVSFATTQCGYIVTELGAVYKTTNGGDNWTSVMNLGFPYYWYGVHALTVDTVVIAGFNNQGNIKSGVVRWSYNGGTTWSGDINLYIPTGVGWLSRIHFFDKNRGIVSAEFSGGMHYTTNGGKDSTGWTYVQVNSDLGWFAGNIDAISDGNVFTTGIHLAHSTNYGVSWTSGPSADNVFDGGVDFVDNNLLLGLTGGGSISPTVSGWLHRTTDGGQTWSARLNTFPYPIRSVKYFNDSIMFAVGGSINQDLGGIYSSTNAGLNWNLDISTGAEMFSYDFKKISNDSIDIWCVGSTGGGSGYIGKLFKARINYTLVGIKPINIQQPSEYKLYQNYPNPFNPSTKIKFDIKKSVVSNQYSVVILKVFDILGKEVATLLNEKLQPGTYEVTFDGSLLASGIYFYKIVAGNFTQVKRMVLVK
ncbi:MAG TPA: T9SS type A sorting domain-containing protein [Ignavibacteria bacterium]